MIERVFESLRKGQQKRRRLWQVPRGSPLRAPSPRKRVHCALTACSLFASLWGARLVSLSVAAPNRAHSLPPSRRYATLHCSSCALSHIGTRTTEQWTHIHCTQFVSFTRSFIHSFTHSVFTRAAEPFRKVRAPSWVDEKRRDEP